MPPVATEIRFFSWAKTAGTPGASSAAAAAAAVFRNCRRPIPSLRVTIPISLSLHECVER
jgi:hypothetical protein